MELSGIKIPANVSTDIFYGFKLDPNTSNLKIEAIAQGNGVVKLPSDNVIDPYDYKQWLWAENTLDFRFQSNGHLEMIIL